MIEPLTIAPAGFGRLAALSGVLRIEAEGQDARSALLSHGWRISAVPKGAAQGAKGFRRVGGIWD